MNEIHETVALPDPAGKPLLHPTDLPEARSLFLRGWWFGRLGSVPVAVLIGAVAWTISGNLLPAVVAPLSTLVLAQLASRWHIARSWDYIPRRRQGTEGAGLRLLASMLDGAALLLTAVTLLSALQTRPLPDGVLAFAVGAAAGVAALQTGEVAVAIARRNPEPVWPRVAMVAAVLGSTLLVAALGLKGDWSAQLLGTSALGAATILLAQSAWWVLSRRGPLTPAARPADPGGPAP